MPLELGKPALFCYNASMNKPLFLVISGPTGVGKTALVEALGAHLPLSIINADMGQMYAPLSIGTAKPDLKKSVSEQYLFDILDEPRSCTVKEYRAKALPLITSLWQTDYLPTFVGGSLFYLHSLFFPQHELPINNEVTMSGDQGWDTLREIDPERAEEIHSHDTYRIQRALELYYATGKKPSTFKPTYNPPGYYLFIWCMRERKELYERIDERVTQMIEQGWIEEVVALQSTPWESFLRTKKIIGYDDILEYLQKGGSKQALIDRIAQKTRHYAKRQIIFWRRFNHQLLQGIKQSNDHISSIEKANLTYLNLDLYIKQLSKNIENKVGMVQNNEL